MSKLEIIGIAFLLSITIFRIGYFTTGELSQRDQKIYIKTRINSSKGKIEKKNEKYPLKNEYVTVDGLKDGNYILEGEIKKEKISKNYVEYSLKVLNFKYLEENILQKKLRKRVEKINENSTYAQKNLHLSVILGDRDGVSDKVKKSFSKSGISHILAISGLHIGILIGVFNWIFIKLKILKIQRNILILIILTAYYFSIRVSPSVTRAYIMGTIFLLGNIFSENSSMKKSFFIALILNVLIFPNSFKEISFILSYGALLGIIFLTPYLFKIQLYLKDKVGFHSLKIINYILFTFFLQLFLSPLLFIFFKDYSMKSIFFSILFTPLGTLYIVSSFLSLIFPLIPLNNLCYNILIKCIEFSI